MAARHGGALALCTRPIYEGNEIGVVQINALNAELRCPICLNLLRQPVATECMHRFCAGCIEKCLRVGKKECPTCRKPVATRRNLRTDHNFMAIITKLYPDLEDFEQEEDALIDNVASRARMVAITAEQQQEMIEHQPAPRRSHKKQMRPSIPAGRKQLGHDARNVLTPRSNEVGFVFVRHPHETTMPSLARDYVTASLQAKVHQLQKFLALKLSVPDWSAFQLSTRLPNKQYQELRQDWSLQTVVAAHHLDTERLELHWQHSNKVVGGPQW